MKDQVSVMVQELDRRITLLENHAGPSHTVQENQYQELLQAVARIVNQALLRELKDLREYAKQDLR